MLDKLCVNKAVTSASGILENQYARAREAGDKNTASLQHARTFAKTAEIRVQPRDLLVFLLTLWLVT